MTRQLFPAMVPQLANHAESTFACKPPYFKHKTACGKKTSTPPESSFDGVFIYSVK